MKQKLLLIILPMLFFTATFVSAQTKVWDFGGNSTYTSPEQIALWPVVSFNAAQDATVERTNYF